MAAGIMPSSSSAKCLHKFYLDHMTKKIKLLLLTCNLGLGLFWQVCTFVSSLNAKPLSVKKRVSTGVHQMERVVH